jgi:hypothetical protein
VEPGCEGRASAKSVRQSEPERAVEVADALVQRTVERLSGYTSDLLGVAARKELLDLRPHLEEALAALEDIERRRSLTDKELAQRHAFKMLLAVMA